MNGDDWQYPTVHGVLTKTALLGVHWHVCATTTRVFIQRCNSNHNASVRAVLSISWTDVELRRYIYQTRFGDGCE